MTSLQDLGYALRRCLREPGFTLTVVLTLGLGIGATVAVFAVVDAVLLHPVAYPEPERIVLVLGNRPQRGPEPVSLTPADVLALRAANRSLGQLGAFRPSGTVDLTEQGEPVQLTRHLVSEGALAALGVRPALGQLFAAEETSEVRRVRAR